MMFQRFRYNGLRRLASHERGVAAVEFALTLPVLLFVFVGVTQVGQAVSISRKVTMTARTVTDLATRTQSLTTASLNSILQASTAVIAPYPSSTLSIIVSEISTDSKGNATVDWSGAWPNNSNALTQGAPFTLPSSLAGDCITVIYGQVSYGYKPILGYKVIGPITLKDSIYLYPRMSERVTYAGTTNTYPTCPLPDR